jgi:sRNA-binding regulator protein Hfq
VYEKSFVRDRTLISAPYAVQPAPAAPAASYVQPAGSTSVSYEELMNLAYSGKTMEVYLQNGSVLRGTLGVVDASILHLNVDGAEMPVSRSVILRISLVPDPSDTRPANRPAGSSGGPTPW